MKNQFRRKLKTMLLLGTILPIVFFVAIFVYKYYTMNLEAFNNQFNKEQEVFARSVETNWEAFDTLFRAKINLIDKQVDNQVIDKTSFYHELLAEEGILNYYHIHHFVEVFATDSNHKDPIHALVRSKPVNQVWLEVSESGNWLLGYTSLGKKDSLVLEVTGQWLFGEHHHFVKDHLYYHIRFEDMDVYKTYKQVTIPASGEGLHNSKGQWYFYKTLGIEDTPLTYTFVKDISREINYVVDSLVWSLLIILVYLLVTSFITRKTSKELLKPLNYLIERVTLVADGENKYYELDNIDLEFKEILDKFEEMLETSYDNMEAIREQSEVIQEKNTIMIDMNETLEQSTEQIEQSTRQWLIYEKQSKILVDNIKDKKKAHSSIELLSPSSYFIVATNKIPLSPDIPYHSIIGTRHDKTGPGSSDGVVQYESSHLDFTVSEKLVPSGHGAHEHPLAIDEVKRILKLHIE